MRRVGRVLLVGSGKGGVGKSFVACGLGLCLAEAGYSTAILDVDVHGSSVPGYLSIGPPLESTSSGLMPKVAGKVKVMSVGLLTGDSPVPVRGDMKQSLITELLALTDWGKLDYLVVDLPPSSGDELLTAFDLFSGKASLILVTTPAENALDVVSRLRRLAASERVPVAGVVLNMAYSGLGESRIYPFGRASRESIEASLDARVLAELPLDPSINRFGLRRTLKGRSGLSRPLRKLAKLVTNSSAVRQRRQTYKP